MSKIETRMRTLVFSVLFCVGLNRATAEGIRDFFNDISGLTQVKELSGVEFSLWKELDESGGYFLAHASLAKSQAESLLKSKFFDSWDYGYVPPEVYRETFGLLDSSTDGIPQEFFPRKDLEYYRILIRFGSASRIYLLRINASSGEAAFYFMYFHY